MMFSFLLMSNLSAGASEVVFLDQLRIIVPCAWDWKGSENTTSLNKNENISQFSLIFPSYSMVSIVFPSTYPFDQCACPSALVASAVLSSPEVQLCFRRETWG
jgi:hypothetical protein